MTTPPVLGREHGPGRQLVQADLVGRQPLVVGVLGRQLGLDLLVLDEAALGRVDQEHAARLEAALAHDALGRDVEHADLAGQHDQPVVGDPVARRAQPVAVEHRADHGAVGEADRGRAVPRLHQRRRGSGRRRAGAWSIVVWFSHASGIIISTACGSERPAEVQQLEHLVEAGRVAGPRRADRVDARQVALNQRRLEQRLAGPHPVAVAGQRVDLAVVAQVAVRVGQRPAREGVGREARVHQGQAGLEGRVAQVGEELAQLLGGEHALVDERAGRQRREVEARRRRARPACAARRRGARAPSVSDARPPDGATKSCSIGGMAPQRGLPQALGLDGHDAPARAPRSPSSAASLLHDRSWPWPRRRRRWAGRPGPTA